MWIEINDEFCDEIKSDINPSTKNFCDLQDVITNLLNMMKKCKHIVFISRKMLEIIKNNENFSSNIRKFAKWILDRFIYIYSGRNYVNHKIIVAKRNDILKMNNCFLVPPSFFSDEKSTKLVVENETDCDVYKGIYKHVKKHKTTNSYYDINFENDSCHGSNVASKICELANQDGIGLLYLDSDQDYEGSARGSTYKAASEEIKKHNNKILELNVLNVREKENLFSPKMYIPFCDSSKINFLTKLDNYNDKNIYYYFDIKDGIKYEKFNDVEWRNHYSAFISKFVTDGVIKTRKRMKDDDICSQSIGDKVCDKVCHLLLTVDDKDFIYKNVKKEYNRNVDDILNMRKNIGRYLPQDLYCEWEIIFEVLSDWGICISDNYRYRL